MQHSTGGAACLFTFPRRRCCVIFKRFYSIVYRIFLTLSTAVMASTSNQSSNREPPTSWAAYMAMKQQKLREQFAKQDGQVKPGTTNGFVDERPPIFNDVSVYVNGLTDPPADELRRLLTEHGGRYDAYYSKTHTKYIIADNLAFSKVVKLTADVKVVRAKWIVDCVQQGRLLPIEEYLVYRPDLVPGQQQLSFAPSGNLNPHSDQDMATEDAIASSDEEELFDDDENSLGQEVSASSTSDSKSASRTLIAGQPGFLEAYFRRSRLHHISTSATNFKMYVQQLRSKSTGHYPARDNIKNHNASEEFKNFDHPVIMHIDMDCFFVSVGLVDRPQLIGQPVVVTHASNDSERIGSAAEVACASYEARSRGVKNGTILGHARTLCPELVAIPYEFDKYTRVSLQLYNIIAQYTLDIEATSCDEVYVDIKQVCNETKLDPRQFADLIRNEIFEQTKCRASVGVARNVFLAKVCSKKAKPNGIVVEMSEPEVAATQLMSEMVVRDLPGIGRATARVLRQKFNAETVEQLRVIDLNVLKTTFGAKTGQKLFDVCRGRDRTVLKFDQVTNRKSVSVDVNYGIRFTDNKDVHKFIDEVSRAVTSKLQEARARGQQVTLKVMVRAKDAPVETWKFLGHGHCDNLSKSTLLRTKVQDAATISRHCIEMYKALNIEAKNLRGVAIQVSKLDVDSNFGAKSAQVAPQKRLINDWMANNSKKVKCQSSRPEPEVAFVDNTVMPQNLEDIDQEVLDSLPFDVRHDILNSLRPRERKPVKPEVKLEIKKELKKDVKKEMKKANKNVIGPLDKLFGVKKTEKIDNSPKSITVDMSRPHICGRVALDEVRELIADWVQSSRALEPDDVLYIKRYLLALIRAEQWILLRSVITDLYELVLLRNEKSWTLAYNDVINQVKQAVERCTSAPADLNEELFILDVFD